MNRRRSSIGGQLDYAQLAQLHVPADPSIEIKRLHSEGLKPRDIASVLAIHIDVVLRALQTGTNRESTALGARNGKDGLA